MIPALNADLAKFLLDTRSTLDKILGIPVPVTNAVDGSIKPIILSDADRNAIEEMAGGIILTTPQDVVAAFSKLSALHVAGISTPLAIPHDYLVRAESRCPIDIPLGEWLQSEFLRFLEMLVDGAL